MKKIKKLIAVVSIATMMLQVSVSAISTSNVNSLAGISGGTQSVSGSTNASAPIHLFPRYPVVVDPSLSGGGVGESGYITRLQGVMPMRLLPSEVRDANTLKSRLLDNVYVESNYDGKFEIIPDVQAVKIPGRNGLEIYNVTYTVKDHSSFNNGAVVATVNRLVMVTNYAPVVTQIAPIPASEAVFNNKERLLGYVAVTDLEDGDLKSRTNVYVSTDSRTGQKRVSYSVTDGDGNYTFTRLNVQ